MLEAFLIPVVIVLVIAAFIAYVAWFIQGQRNVQRFDFLWYRQEFPELVKDGRVACYRCHSKDTGVERKMNHSYVRSHFCRSCGTTLYYSREQ